jgi:hypothetical protein
MGYFFFVENACNNLVMFYEARNYSCLVNCLFPVKHCFSNRVPLERVGHTLNYFEIPRKFKIYLEISRELFYPATENIGEISVANSRVFMHVCVCVCVCVFSFS